MAWLVLGVLLWSSAHLLPSAGASVRAGWMSRLGEGPYKGLFALTILLSVVLMVLGWRAAEPVHLYAAPGGLRLITNLLMAIALVLFVASGVPTNLKRVLRHPQLTGVATWSVAHLLSNGDSRSLVLFGGIGVWALVAMVCINLRDGAWQKPEPLPMSAEIRPLVGGVVLFAILFFAHPWIAGVSATPG
jgi:uncharacterized membrane protein